MSSRRDSKAPSDAAKGGAGGSQGAPKAPKAAAGGSKAGARASKGGARRGRSKAQARELSAGGVVLRGEEVAVIVPTRRAADGARVLALPKGHVDPGETPIQAAEREVREEAGIVARPVRELGESRYWYRRDGRTIGKSVHFFLFEYLEGDTEDHDDEVEEARWIGLGEARDTLTYPAEREMVALALACLEEGELKDR
jgi:8-oxo-dGTP pyrophosphatase MutT (NUDIX family)